MENNDKVNAINQKDALAFLDEIRREFPSNEKVFQDFVNIMADFKIHKIGTKEVLERTTKLFNGHGTLIRLFIQFLPPGHVMKQNEKNAACFEITTPAGDHIIVDSSRGEIIES